MPYPYIQRVVGMRSEFNVVVVCGDQRFHFETPIVAEIDHFFFQQPQIHVASRVCIFVYKLHDVIEARIVA